jgi:hypothetical protein
MIDSAWQAALAAEQQAGFGYALLGPQLDAIDQHLARSCQAAHIALVERTAAAISAAGRTPAVPAADYPNLYPVTSAVAARQLAVRLEVDCARAWRYLYAVAAATSGVATTARRHEAQAALTGSAVRAVRWRQRSGAASATVPFPGIS